LKNKVNMLTRLRKKLEKPWRSDIVI